jgi:malonyl-CoA O-methyltransferase
LLDALASKLTRPDGRLGLTVELVFGHAVKPAPRHKVAPETRVSLQDMKRMVRKADKP